MFRTRNNSVSQLCGVAEDWSVLCLLASSRGEPRRAVLGSSLSPSASSSLADVSHSSPARTNHGPPPAATDQSEAGRQSQFQCSQCCPAGMPLISASGPNQPHLPTVNNLLSRISSPEFISLLTTANFLAQPPVSPFLSSTVVSPDYPPTGHNDRRDGGVHGPEENEGK